MRTLAALLVGVLSGAAGTVLHQTWWGLALGLATSASLLVLRFHLRTSALMRAAAAPA